MDVKGEEAARIDNQIDVFSKAFLGMTVACARCHDHKFDAITAADYYALAGFLQSSRRRIEWLDSDDQQQRKINQILEQRDSINAVALREAAVWSTETLTSQLLQMIGTHHAVAPNQQQASLDSQPVSHAGKDDAAVFNPADPLSLMAFLQTARKKYTPPKDAATDDAADGHNAVSNTALMEKAGAWSRRVLMHASSNPASDVDQAQTVLFASLQSGIPEGWLAYGQALMNQQSGASSSQQSLVRWSTAGPAITTTNGVSSLDIAPNLKGSLQSPTFELQHPEVLVLVAGQNSRVRLVIDGYVMNEFSELLFNGAKQSINTEGQFRWIRLNGDVHRYMGHRCHLEFLDEGDGWFCVKEIRFAVHPGGRPPQTETASEFNVRLATAISGEHISTIAELIQTYADHVIRHQEWPAIAARLQLLPSFRSALNPSVGTTTATASPAQATNAKSLTTGAPETSVIQDFVNTWQHLAENLPEGDPVMVMCDGSPEDEHLFIRGSHRNRGALVPRQFLTAFVSQSSESAASADWTQTGSGRLYLADQVTGSANSLTSRVAVNRIWQHMFGRGIVSSADNFGVLGSPPTHPELLDYLATRFQTEDWSVKKLIRLIALSRTYRQSSTGRKDANAADPTNALLHRARVRRLEGETIRDAILAVAGQLRPTVYGPPVPVHLTAFMQGRGRPKNNGPLDGDGRRSIYQSVNRNFLAPFLLAFDTPAPATAVGRRSTSNVPAQALILMNNAFVEQQTRHWAQRLVAESQPSNLHATGSEISKPEDQQYADIVSLAFRHALARTPTEAELQLFIKFSKAQAEDYGIATTESSALNDARVVADICHVLLNQKEFVFLE